MGKFKEFPYYTGESAWLIVRLGSDKMGTVDVVADNHLVAADFISSKRDFLLCCNWAAAVIGGKRTM